MNTLVYGLHTDYEANKAWIEEHFHVTGYFDQDESRLPAKGGIKKAELKKALAAADIVLVTADPVSIVGDLMEEYDCPREKIRVLFYELEQMPKSLRTFHGERCEDAALLLLCCELGLSFSELRYLEIGTNDPVRYNQTYNLYRLGARGLLVDALLSVETLAQMARPEDRFLHAAVSDRNRGRMSFFASKSSTVSSLSEEHHKEWDGLSHNEVHEITVDVLGVNEVLERCGAVPDVLLVDAEGEDERIVRGIDFGKYRPRILMVEVNHLEGEVDLGQFLREKGYEEYATVANNTIFVTRDAWESRPGKEAVR